MESKIHATERLRRDGRWDQASAFRDETRRKLRAEGKSKIEAGELAWEAMIAKYPPPEHPPLRSEDEPLPREEDDAEEDLDALDERFAEGPPNLVRDTLWVYENLGRKPAAAANAPGRGAWELLKWVRQHQDRFFQQMLPKAMGAKAEQQEVRPRLGNHQPMTQERLRELIRNSHLQVAEDLVTDAPQAIRQRVQSTLSNWLTINGVTLLPEVYQMLDLDVTRVVHEVVRAALQHPEAFQTEGHEAGTEKRAGFGTLFDTTWPL